MMSHEDFFSFMIISYIESIPWNALNLNQLIVNPVITWNMVYKKLVNKLTGDVFVLNPNSWVSEGDGEITPDIYYAGFSSNPNVTLDIVMANPEVNWDWNDLIRNESITWNDVMSHLDSFMDNLDYTLKSSKSEREDFLNRIAYDFSSKSCITLDVVLANPDLNWNYYRLAANKGISWNDVNIDSLPSKLKEEVEKYFEYAKLIYFPKKTPRLKKKLFLGKINYFPSDVPRRVSKHVTLEDLVEMKEEFFRQVQRCKVVKEDIFIVCSQPAWFFSSCLSKEEQKEIDFVPELHQADAVEQMPLNFRVRRHPWP